MTVLVGDTSCSRPKEDFKVTLAMAGIAGRGRLHASVCNVPSGFGVDDPVAVVEGNNVIFTVTALALTSAATVQYATVDDTARAGSDFTAKTGTLNFPVGSSSQTVTVATLADGDGAARRSRCACPAPRAATSSSTRTAPAPSRSHRPSVNRMKSAPTRRTSTRAELYFEMFRYLTGGPVKSGHWGDNDYTGQQTKNLDEECYLPGLREPGSGRRRRRCWPGIPATGRRQATGGEADLR